jgi:hypothetical protein
MIETTTKVTTLSGRTYTLPVGHDVQLWELRLECRHVDSKTGYASTDSGRVAVVHVEREVLEKHGLLPDARPRAQQKAPAPEDLMREVLVSLGVKFED